MTFRTPTSPPPSSGQLSGAIASAAQPVGSPDIQQINSDERWSRWALQNASRDFMSERRFQIIAGVIISGVVAWFIWTM